MRIVNAEMTLMRVAAALTECRLEAVLIGSAAAALQGAPVTTLDFDFMFRKTPANMTKLKRLADCLGGQILRPYYPSSGLYRLVVEETGLQLDFMSAIHGVKSFSALRSRAVRVEFGGHQLLVADLQDILRSKKAANRPRDRAVLEVLQRTIDEKRKGQG
jgi:predicted nucleotidyltransferase